MKRRSFVLAGSSAAILSACGGGGAGSGGVGSVTSAQNRFEQANLAASSASFKAKFTLPDMVDAWGIAIRPAGAGGHFWVGGGGSSWEFMGDVHNSSDASLREITVDQLTRMTVPDAGTSGHVTGVTYNGAALTSANFVPVDNATGTRQTMPDSTGALITMEGSARFIFVTDNGFITAWTERRQDTGAVLRSNGNAQKVFDGSALGHAYFGAAVKPGSWDTLWVADFGSDPQIRQFDASWNLVPTTGFANPFGTGTGGTAKPGDFVPFNILALGSRVFVTYAKSRVNPSDLTQFFAGEEDALDADQEKTGGFVPDRGRLVEFDLSGNLVRIYKDEKHLNAPWGVAIAPSSFGAFGGAVLVGNFGGGGYITAFDGNSGSFLGYLPGLSAQHRRWFCRHPRPLGAAVRQRRQPGRQRRAVLRGRAGRRGGRAVWLAALRTAVISKPWTEQPPTDQLH